MIVTVRISGKEVPMMIDTGSEVTVVRPGILENELENWGGKLRGVSGHTVRVEGWATVKVELGSKSEMCSVMVADLGRDGILGMDVLKQFGVVLDCKEETLTVGGGNLHIQPWDQRGTESLAVEKEAGTNEMEELKERSRLGLTELQSKELDRIMVKYEATLGGNSELLGCTPLVTHSINTGDSRPIRQSVRRMGPQREKVAADALLEM